MKSGISSHILEFGGDWLERGFWLYVWEVKVPGEKEPWHYVGRTGDSSSLNAASPFNRMGQHLDLRLTASAAMLTRNLQEKAKVKRAALVQCQFRLIAVGPILKECRPRDPNDPTQNEKEAHYKSRDIVAAMESALEKALRDAKYRVLNEVKSRKRLDVKRWKPVLVEFATHFKKLRTSSLLA